MASGFSGTRFGDLHKGNWIGGEIADKSVDPHSKNVPEQIYASARMFGKTGARCFSLIDQLFYAEQQRFAEDKPTPLSVQNVGTIPISRVTADLSPGEATLEYVLPEKGNAYCIFLSHNSVSIIRLGPAAQLAALARTFVDDLARNKPWKENSQAQYAAVLTPIPNIDQFNRLTIVPDGDLHLVPFDALSSPSGKLLGETAVYGLCTIGCE